MQSEYIVAEPYTGKPLINATFTNYEQANHESAKVAGSIVTNAQFVARKGHKLPQAPALTTYRRLTGSLAGERPTGRGRREFSTQQKAPAR